MLHRAKGGQPQGVAPTAYVISRKVTYKIVGAVPNICPFGIYKKMRENWTPISEQILRFEIAIGILLV